MARRKCVICGEFIEEGTKSVPFKNRYAHEHCFNITMKVTTTASRKKVESSSSKPKSTRKPKSDLKEGLSEEEFANKTSFFNTVRNISGQQDVQAKTYKVVGDYIRDFQFTYKDMEQALTYFYLIKDNSPKGDCVGIIPYIIDESMEFYKTIDLIKEKTESLNGDISEMYQIKKVYINSDVKIDDPRKIDMSSIVEY